MNLRSLTTCAAAVILTMVTGCNNKPTQGTQAETPPRTQLRTGSGLSANDSPAKAGQEAVAMAMKELGGNEADVIIVYVNYPSADKDHDKFVKSLESAFGGAKQAAGNNLVVGACATAGIISSHGFGDAKSVAALALKGEGGIKIKVAHVEDILEDLAKAGEALGSKLKGEDDKALILITDSNISHNKPEVADFLAGINKVIPKGVPIVGGNAMGNSDFDAPVYYKDKLIEKCGIGIMLSGEIKVGIGIANNFKFVNENPMKITKSEGRKVFALDDKPVADVVTELTKVDKAGQLKEDCSAALANIFAYKVEDRPLIRFQRALKEDASGVYYDGFPNSMPEGREVYLAKWTQEKLLPSSKESVQHALASMGDAKPVLVLPFVCCSRSFIGKMTQEETKMISDTVGEGIPVTGFYACGEYYTTDWRKENEQARYCQFSSIIMVLGQ